ncbi:putative ADP ribosylation factor 1 [Peniophora sp. CONT]|nr:putative ADP ribosylation factor 1 [Peniophora sp. CONT]
MGVNLSYIGRLFANEEVKVLMLGLDATGKSTIVYWLVGHKGFIPIPTIGFNLETIRYQSLDFIVQDFGGGEKLRPIWHCYYHSARAVIFVTDCGDRERIDEARTELHKHIMSYDNLRELPVLVYANKQDLEKAMTVEEVTEKLGMHELKESTWHVQSSCGKTGAGLYEGLHWLAQNFNKPR